MPISGLGERGWMILQVCFSSMLLFHVRRVRRSNVRERDDDNDISRYWMS